jgi:hypothetical protein
MLKFHALHPDWTTILSAALPASLLLLALCILVLSFTLRRGHRAHRTELARVFEQLDLLRFDAQQVAAAAAAAPGSGGVPAAAGAAGAAREAAQLAALLAREPDLVGGAGDYYAAAQLAARGSSAAEIANRCGIVNGEARVLVALQQARARRTSH